MRSQGPLTRDEQNGLSLIAKANPKPASADSVQRMLRAAERAAAAVLKDNLHWIEAERSRLRALDFRLKEEGLNQQIIDDLYLAAHDLRGQADYLDMPLLTQLSHSLCHLFDQSEDEMCLPVEMLCLFLDGQQMLLREKVTKMGGEKERLMVDGLCEAATLYLQKVV